MTVSRVYLSSDVAFRLAEAGLSIRTPAAVRQAVQDGRLHPDMQSPTGVSVWSETALLRDLAALVTRQAELRRLGLHRGPRRPAGDVQAELSFQDPTPSREPKQ